MWCGRLLPAPAVAEPCPSRGIALALPPPRGLEARTATLCREAIATRAHCELVFPSAGQENVYHLLQIMVGIVTK